MDNQNKDQNSNELVLISEKLYRDLFSVVGKNKNKSTNEHTLQAYIAICILNNKFKDPNKVTLTKICEYIGKRERRTEDIIKELVEKGLVKRHEKGYEVIG